MSKNQTAKRSNNGSTKAYWSDLQVVPRAKRQITLSAAYALHPECFVHGAPSPHALLTAVWMNPPTHAVASDPTNG